MSIDELKDIHKGRTCAILGGGPSLMEYQHTIPQDAILISVNYRPARIWPCDYIVFWDADVCEKVKDLPGEKISPFEAYRDYWPEPHLWNGGYSAQIATYLGCWMGCDPVLLYGIDCYQEGKPYFDSPPGETHPKQSRPLEYHLKSWAPALERCPNSHAIKAVSGPLVDLFGRWEA